jgi:hypothetical protein
MCGSRRDRDPVVKIEAQGLLLEVASAEIHQHHGRPAEPDSVVADREGNIGS